MTTPDERLLNILERIEQRLAALEASAQRPASAETPATVQEPEQPEAEPEAQPEPQPVPEEPVVEEEPIEKAPIHEEPTEEEVSSAPPDAPSVSGADEDPEPAEPESATMGDTIGRLRERKHANRETDQETPDPKRAAADARLWTVRTAHSAHTKTPPTSPAASRPAFSPLPPPPAPPKREVKRDPIGIERLIGGKSFMILGVLIVVAGAGLFLKLAYDEGWYRHITPLWRCIFSGLFGVLLLGAGEIARAKLGKFASVGFTAAGVGVLYATAYSTFGIFTLVSAIGGFWMLVAVCAIGLFTGIRANSQLLTALALTGGYSAPLIARADGPHWALPSYLLMLLVVGSAVTVVTNGHRVLSSIAWWGSGLLGTIWLVLNAADAPWVALAFVFSSWGVAQITQSFFVMRKERASFWPDASLIASTGTTLWGAGAVLYATDQPGAIAQWVPMLLLAIGTLALAMYHGNGFEVLRRVPATLRERLGVAFFGQAAALVPLVVFLAFDAPWVQSIVWTAMGVGACLIAARTRMITMLFYAGVLLALGSVRALLHGIHDDAITGTLPGLGGIVYTPRTALIAGAGIAWLIGAWCTDRLTKTTESPLLKGSRPLVAAFAGAHFVLMLLHENMSSPAYVVGLTVLGLVALGASFIKKLRPEALWGAGVYGVLALPVWLASYVSQEWATAGAPLVFNEAMLWTGLLATLLIGFAHQLRAKADDVAFVARRIGWSVAGVLLLVATSVEVTHIADAMFEDKTVQAGALSLWWALCGVGLIVAGVLRRVSTARYAGIGLLLVATGKVLTYDLAALSDMARVASFIVVGLLLLAVATGYLRSTKLREDAAEEEVDDE